MSEVRASPYQGIPNSGVELDFRAAALPERTSPYHPVTLKSVEEV